MVATFLGAGEVEAVAQQVEQAHPGFELQVIRLTVDAQVDRVGRRTGGGSGRRRVMGSGGCGSHANPVAMAEEKDHHLDGAVVNAK